MLRRSLVVGLVAVLAVAGCSQANDSDTQEPDPLAVATSLVDDWMTAWNTEDMDLLLSVFSDDAVYIDPNGTRVGHDEIRAYAEQYFGAMWDAQRLGDGVETETETGEYLFSGSFDWADGTNEGDFEVELADDLITHWGWFGWRSVSD